MRQGGTVMPEQMASDDLITDPASPTEGRADNRGGVQVIQRATRILRVLSDHPEGLSLSQIASRVGLARSTVHRLVAALEEERLVTLVSPNGRFRLGSTLAMFGLAVQRDLATQLHPYLVSLSRSLNETVDLAVLEHDQVHFIDQVAARRRLRAVSAVGSVFPAHCTANGKVLLATLTPDRVDQLLPRRLERLTPYTVTDRKALLAEIDEVRAGGIAFDRQEHTIGICAVGVAILTDSQVQPAAITVPLPTQRFVGNEDHLVAQLLETCEAIQFADAQ
jgi:DNA-binding IclR family transcriptional regulator